MPDSAIFPHAKFAGRNRHTRKSRKEQFKLPPNIVTQDNNTKTSGNISPSKVLYHSRGDTIRTQRSKSTNLQDLTAAFQQNISKDNSIDSEKDDQRWLDKVNQAVDVIDHDSYDLFARRRKLTKTYIPQPGIPKHEKMEAAEVQDFYGDVYNDDCEEDIEGVELTDIGYSKEYVQNGFVNGAVAYDGSKINHNGTVENEQTGIINSEKVQNGHSHQA